jgi:hypothetical protein
MSSFIWNAFHVVHVIDPVGTHLKYFDIFFIVMLFCYFFVDPLQVEGGAVEWNGEDYVAAGQTVKYQIRARILKHFKITAEKKA